MQAALIDAGVGVRNQLTVDGRKITVRDHITAIELKAHFGTKWSKLWKVAMVRNPWDRYVSSYYYNKQGLCQRFEGKAKPWTYYPRVFASQCLPFKLWAWLYPIRPVTQFICDADGEVLIDQVYAYEHMDCTLEQLRKGLGFADGTLQLPQMNVSVRRRDYTGYFDGMSRRIVERRLAHEISQFGYEFERQPQQGCLYAAAVNTKE